MPRNKLRITTALKRIVLLGVVPAIAIAAAGVYWLQGARYVSTQNAYVKTNIAKLAAEVSGKVIEVRAQAHKHVMAGDVLVRIDPEPFELVLARAQAQLDAARQQVETLRASLSEARLELNQAQDRAQDKITGARQKIRRALASLGGAPGRPVDEHPLVRVMLIAVQSAKLDLERTLVRAPASGIIVTVPLVAGEQITANTPLFAIVTDIAPWVDANFKETKLTWVRVGQSATIGIDTYPGVIWEGEVKSISPATGAEFALLPPQNASGNWVKVVQRLPVRLQLTPRSGMPPLRAGMTATVTIDTGRERRLSDILGRFGAAAKGARP